MIRLIALLASLALAFGLAVWTSQAPAPRGPGASAESFSAIRAMTDVREIARAPHAVGSTEHARVRAYLLERMRDLGLEVSTQAAALSQAGRERHMAQGGAATDGLVNLIGVLPGRDRSQPAVALMAHYDTVPGSPGAADDSAGVAAALEAVRAIRQRGVAERDLILLLTDAEELHLDGAEAFFGANPLAARVGAVVNLEARGGGGRAMMFETGPRAAETVDLFARAMREAPGGATTNSLAAMVYEAMPNGTDMTVPKRKGIAGINLAFIGRPAQYHDPAATPENLDQGGVQHLGGLALASADALLRAERLPRATTDGVYGDLFGTVVARHPAWVGWLLWAAATGLLALAAMRFRRAGLLPVGAVTRGAGAAVFVLAAGGVLAATMRALAGPTGRRVHSAEFYYALLRRLPWIETGIGLALLAVTLAALAGVAGRARWAAWATLGLAAVAVTLLAGVQPIPLGLLVVGAGALLALRPDDPPAARAVGAGGLLLALGAAAQGAAPPAAFIITWPALAGAAGLAAAALIDPRLSARGVLTVLGLTAAVVVGWLLYLAHPVLLGVGMDLPLTLALFAPLALPVLVPLAPTNPRARTVLLAAAAVALIVGAGVAATARLAQPIHAVATR